MKIENCGKYIFRGEKIQQAYFFPNENEANGSVNANWRYKADIHYEFLCARFLQICLQVASNCTDFSLDFQNVPDPPPPPPPKFPLFLFISNSRLCFLDLTYAFRLLIEHGSSATALQHTEICYIFLAAPHGVSAFFISSLIDHLLVCFGCPILLFPCGFQYRVWVTFPDSSVTVCPIHLYCLLLFLCACVMECFVIVCPIHLYCLIFLCACVMECFVIVCPIHLYCLLLFLCACVMECFFLQCVLSICTAFCYFCACVMEWELAYTHMSVRNWLVPRSIHTGRTPTVCT